MFGYMNLAFCISMVMMTAMASLLAFKKTRDIPWVKKIFPVPYLLVLAISGLIAVYHDSVGKPLGIEVGTKYRHVQGEKGKLVWLERVNTGEVRVFILPENFQLPPEGQVFKVKEDKELKQEVEP